MYIYTNIQKYIYTNNVTKKSILVTVEEEVIFPILVIAGDVDDDRLHAVVYIIRRSVLVLEVQGLSDNTRSDFVVGAKSVSQATRRMPTHRTQCTTFP